MSNSYILLGSPGGPMICFQMKIKFLILKVLCSLTPEEPHFYFFPLLSFPFLLMVFYPR